MHTIEKLTQKTNIYSQNFDIKRVKNQRSIITFFKPAEVSFGVQIYPNSPKMAPQKWGATVTLTNLKLHTKHWIGEISVKNILYAEMNN